MAAKVAGYFAFATVAGVCVFAVEMADSRLGPSPASAVAKAANFAPVGSGAPDPAVAAAVTAVTQVLSAVKNVVSGVAKATGMVAPAPRSRLPGTP
jgi:hypothetical protein